MAEPFNPTSALTRGRKNWIWVPTIADMAVPKVSELTAASAIDITLAIFAASGSPTKSTSRTAGEKRWGATSTPQRLGDSTLEGGDLLWPTDPQALGGEEGVLLWETFEEPASGFFVRRLNVRRSIVPTIGQFVSVYAVDVDAAFEMEQGEGETAEAAAMASYVVTDVAQRVALVA